MKAEVKMRTASGGKRNTSYTPVVQTSSHDQRPVTFQHQGRENFHLNELQHNQTKSNSHHAEPQTFQKQLDLAFSSDAEVEQEVQAKEVYICNCCGISKELNPSIEFMSTFRALFFLFNFLVFAFGLANFGLGLWFRIDPKVYEIHKYIETQNFTIAGWILLVCGISACIIALIGFASAANQAAGVLVFYFVIMIPLTLAFVGTLVLLTVYGFGSSLEKFLTKEIYEQIRRRSMSADSDLFASGDASQFMDFIQVKMRCCGANDFRDYGKLGMIVPTTCYTIDKNYVSAPGCGRAIRNMLDLRAGLAAGFTSGSIVAQLLSTILSALMFCSIYHFRANSRPMTPTSGHLEPSTSFTTANIQNSPSHHQHLHMHQRPRSRTPIII